MNWFYPTQITGDYNRNADEDGTPMYRRHGKKGLFEGAKAKQAAR
jgi:hypothetical protein